MEKYNPLFCKWCKKEIEGKGWSDGPARYCNHRCFSAKSFWGFVACSLFLVPFTILIIVYPDLLIRMLINPSADPIAAVAGSPVLMLIIVGFLVAVTLTTIGFAYSAYVGWIERRSAKSEDDQQYSHTQYFD